MSLPVTLALREMRHDWLAAACFIAALVGVLAPFLIVLALKNGAIDALLDRLIDDPANLELIAIGAGEYDPPFFEELQARGDVLFVVPKTRSINAQANAVQRVLGRALVRNVSLIPSAPGDPISDGANVSPGQVALSSRLADDIDVAAGDQVEMRIDRRLDGALEIARVTLSVVAIVPPENYGRVAMFISIEDMSAVEAFRDDQSVTADNWMDPRPAPDTYASFRLYAQDLAQLSGLEGLLEDRGVNVRLRAENADLLLLFKRNADLLFLIVAGLAVAGFWAAMASNLRGAVERQRHSLSLLNLLGMTARDRGLVPVTQSIVLVMIGVLVSVLLVLPLLIVVNTFFTPAGFERIATLGVGQIFGTILLGLFTAVSASVWAVFATREISPDEVLRTN